MSFAFVCFIVAAVFFALGFFNFVFSIGNPSKQYGFNWVSGGLFWVVLGLWIMK